MTFWFLVFSTLKNKIKMKSKIRLRQVIRELNSLQEDPVFGTWYYISLKKKF
jgi:hypothetical protein